MPRIQVNNTVRDMTAEEIAENQARETEWNNGAFNRVIKDLRQRRTQLLVETDFYALSDVTMAEAMTTYRQALRDLPSGLSTVEDVKNATYPTKVNDEI
jgi:hypothetical protein